MPPPRSYLFVTFEGGGNVPAVLGLVRRLTVRGHEVRVLTEPCLRCAVEGCGADFVAFTRHFTRERRTEDLARDWQAKTPIGALRSMFERVVFGPARIVVEETRVAIERQRPDVVVADLMMPGALFAAEAAGIPRVVAFHTPEYLPGPGRPAAGPGFLPRNDLIGRLRDGLLTRLFFRQLRNFLPAVNDARASVGLRPLTAPEALVDEFHRADLRLIQTSRAFDFPIVPAPFNVRYAGPVLDDPDWTEPWVSPWADDSRPLVVASFSTTFQNQRDVLQRTISALGRLDVRALVTLGPCMAEETFSVPENVATVASASHAQVFPHAAVVVTHAGHGTVMRALVHGVPLLCLPMGRDQDDNAARVVANRAGLRLPPRTGPARIADAVGQLLEEPDFRMNARRLGEIIARDVADDVATRELEAVGLRRTRQPA
jgi:UDP:flavonoid glycosyltransferase YjiC (YdhE family)